MVESKKFGDKLDVDEKEGDKLDIDEKGDLPGIWEGLHPWVEQVD